MSEFHLDTRKLLATFKIHNVKWTVLQAHSIRDGYVYEPRQML